MAILIYVLFIYFVAFAVELFSRYCRSRFALPRHGGHQCVYPASITRRYELIINTHTLAFPSSDRSDML